MQRFEETQSDFGLRTYLPLDAKLLYPNVEGRLHRNARQGRLGQPAKKGETAALPNVQFKEACLRIISLVVLVARHYIVPNCWL